MKKWRAIFRNVALIPVLSVLFTAAVTASDKDVRKPSPIAPSQCAGLKESISSHLKFIALQDAEGVGDDSAPRAIMRLTRQMIEWQQIQIDVQLMGQFGCAPYSGLMSPAGYVVAALHCETAVRSWRGTGRPEECDLSKWTDEIEHAAHP